MNEKLDFYVPILCASAVFALKLSASQARLRVGPFGLRPRSTGRKPNSTRAIISIIGRTDDEHCKWERSSQSSY